MPATRTHRSLFARLRPGARRLWPVLCGWGLAPSERREHQRVLRQRLASMASIVALALLAWIPVDLATLPADAALHMLALRLFLAAAVAVLALSQHRQWGLDPEPAAFLFVMIQAAGFAAMEVWVPSAASPLVRLGYGLFPFMVAAQVAVFPLSLLRSLLLALPSLGLLLLPAWQGPFTPELARQGGLWLLLLIILISAWAATSQLSLLLDLLRARNDAAHDGLTGLANRRNAMSRLDADIANAHRHRHPLCVLALDLDHFKRVNDEHGHAAGDRVLVEFAAVLRDNLRRGDLGARIGGEEFIAVLPQTDAAAAGHVAERIRAQCAALRVPCEDGDPIRFTISVGLARLAPAEDTSRLLARADQALYRAKNTGRNRVVADADAPAPDTAGIS